MLFRSNLGPEGKLPGRVLLFERALHLEACPIRKGSHADETFFWKSAAFLSEKHHLIRKRAFQ